MTTFTTSREIEASIDQVFAAISEPNRLMRWCGPAGFTNTFHHCDFRPGGRWSFTMHGPDGQSYANENVFDEIAPPSKVVIRHVFEPKFSLAITLTASDKGTRVSWAQAFEDAHVAQRVESIVVPANEQNLDRLTAEVLRTAGLEGA